MYTILPPNVLDPDDRMEDDVPSSPFLSPRRNDANARSNGHHATPTRTVDGQLMDALYKVNSLKLEAERERAEMERKLKEMQLQYEQEIRKSDVGDMSVTVPGVRNRPTISLRTVQCLDKRGYAAQGKQFSTQGNDLIRLNQANAEDEIKDKTELRTVQSSADLSKESVIEVESKIRQDLSLQQSELQEKINQNQELREALAGEEEENRKLRGLVGDVELLEQVQHEFTKQTRANVQLQERVNRQDIEISTLRRNLEDINVLREKKASVERQISNLLDLREKSTAVEVQLTIAESERAEWMRWLGVLITHHHRN